MCDIHNLQGQFFLTKYSTPDISGWTKITIGEYILVVQSLVQVIKLLNVNGDTIGIMLGTVINGNGYIQKNDFTIDAENITDDLIESTIYAMSGRFLAIIIYNGKERVYLDPCGSMGVVYSTIAPIAASTTTLIDYVHSQTSEGHRYQRVHGELEINKFYPFGITSCPEIMRVLPNHYLDLKNAKTTRHFPGSSPLIYQNKDYVNDHIIPSINVWIKKNVHAIVNNYSTYITLTSGLDSRVILSTMASRMNEIRSFTFKYQNGQNNEREIAVVKKIHRKYSLDHTIVPVQDVSSKIKNEYSFRIGYDGNTGKANDFYYSCIQHINLNSALLTGFTGEIIKNNWNKKYPVKKFKSIDEFMKLTCRGNWNKWINNGIYSRSKLLMEEWLKKNDYLEPYTIAELAYIENRLGCWYSVHSYGFAPFESQISPMTDRKIVEYALMMPYEYKMCEVAPRRIIDINLPSLNKYSELDMLTRLKRYVKKTMHQKLIK